MFAHWTIEAVRSMDGERAVEGARKERVMQAIQGLSRMAAAAWLAGLGGCMMAAGSDGSEPSSAESAVLDEAAEASVADVDESAEAERIPRLGGFRIVQRFPPKYTWSIVNGNYVLSYGAECSSGNGSVSCSCALRACCRVSFTCWCCD